MTYTKRKPLPHVDASVSVRFWRHVSKDEDGCWNWTGSLQRSGYASLKIRGSGYLVHRISYLIHFGVDPGDQLVCHSCDNRRCVNPDHLWLGTYKDNYGDARQKGRTTAPPLGAVQGEDVWCAVLTEKDALEIRKLYGGTETYGSLGQRFGVSRFVIRDVVKGRTWRQAA